MRASATTAYSVRSSSAPSSRSSSRSRPSPARPQQHDPARDGVAASAVLRQPAAHRAHPVSGQPPAVHLPAEIIRHLKGWLTSQGRVQPCARRLRRGPGHQVRDQVRDPGRGVRVRVTAGSEPGPRRAKSRSPTPTNSSWLNRIEAQFTALRYFALDGTDHASHKEQASMIRRYIIWRNNHAYDKRLRRIVGKANVA